MCYFSHSQKKCKGRRTKQYFTARAFFSHSKCKNVNLLAPRYTVNKSNHTQKAVLITILAPIFWHLCVYDYFRVESKREKYSVVTVIYG